MTKILLITIAITLFTFTILGARNLIQNETNKITVSPTPNISPTIIENRMTYNTFSLSNFNRTKMFDVYAKTIGEYNKEQIIEELYPNQWRLFYGNTILSIVLNEYESSPFTSDTEPEIERIQTKLSEEKLYRIEQQDNIYFYTDKYFHDCGQEYCSNGIIDLNEDLRMMISCGSIDETSTDVNFCDEVVKNLDFELL